MKQERPTVAAEPRSIAELAQIAWHRARRFPPRMRPGASTRSVSPRWLAVLIWPAVALVTAREAGWIRTVPGASATVHGARSPGQASPDRRARLCGAALAALVVAATASCIYVLGVLVPAALPPRFGLLGLLPLLAAFIAFEGAMLALALSARRRDRRDPEASIRNLNRRRDELAAAGPAYTLTWVLADHDRTGAAGRLLRALTTEWSAQAACAVLYPASDELVDYYTRYGAVIDAPAHRRMLWRPTRSCQCP